MFNPFWWRRIFLLLVVLGVTVFLHVETGKGADGNLHVFFFHVPVGDAFFLKTPGGKTAVIDGGIDATILPKIASRLPFWEKNIDLLVVTHPDLDHLFGAVAVLEKYQVRNVLISGMNSTNPVFVELLKLVQQQNIPLLLGEADFDFSFDGVLFDILVPQNTLVGSYISKPNASSLVFRTHFRGSALLFTGDIEKETEMELLLSPINLQSDILKVGHHGSKTSSTASFLKSVSPSVAIISAGEKNHFGHPHGEVLERLVTAGSQIFITKECDDIHLIFDKQEVVIDTEREPSEAFSRCPFEEKK